MVKEVKNWAEFQAALNSAGDKLVVVDFTAKWCGPCQQIAPIFKKMADADPGVVFLKVDVDEASDVSQNCNIRCMPTFHFYKNGEKIEEFSGADVKKLQETVAKHK